MTRCVKDLYDEMLMVRLIMVGEYKTPAGVYGLDMETVATATVLLVLLIQCMHKPTNTRHATVFEFRNASSMPVLSFTMFGRYEFS